MVCWWWTPCSCASNDSLPNTQLSLIDLAMVEEGFEWKATWGRLEIKVQMVGMESLDLNTWVGGSLSENEWWKLCFVLMALLESRWGWRGINSLHPKSNRYTLLTQIGETEHKLGETDLCKRYERWAFWWDRSAMARANFHFGISDCFNSVILKWNNVITETWSSHLDGTGILFGQLNC